MQVATDYDQVENEHFLDISLTTKECQEILEGQLISKQKKIVGKLFNIGVLISRGDEECH